MPSRHFNPLSDFVPSEKIPLAINAVQPGLHPALAFHNHDYSELVIVYAGDARHIVEEKSCHIEAGDVLCIHPGVFHAYDETQTLGIYNILYDAQKLAFPLLDGLGMDFYQKLYAQKSSVTDMVQPLLHLDPTQLGTAVEIEQKLDNELHSCNSGSQLGALTQFLELTLFLARCTPQQRSSQHLRFAIGEALAYMCQHFAEPIKLEKLAKISNMSQRNFSRLFHVSVGCSPITYLMQLRLQAAAQKLIDTDLSITEIAYLCGFYDSNSLSKLFRRSYLITPRKYREQHRR